MNIVIVNYDMGNLRSVQKAFERAGCMPVISDDLKVIERADKLVLPGVGHFALGMQKLKSKGIEEMLHYKVNDKKVPIVGICLGMQLLTRSSEEGDGIGLSWIDATTIRFNFAERIPKIPHMGWNTIVQQKKSRMLEGIDEDAMFYFVHSYFVECKNDGDVLLKTMYGTSFSSAVEKENILGFQFHPEKSHKAGLQLIKNFIEKF